MTSKPSVSAEAHQASVLRRVGENLYRHTSGTYYALVKRAGKQFRRSLKTTDRALAARRLVELRRKVANLTTSTALFDGVSDQWLGSVLSTR